MNREDGDDRVELAHQRTTMAEDRTVLANERTFAGWMRTSFAAIGIGLGFNALFERLEPQWIPKTIATAFLLIGIYMIFTAERRACKVLQRMDTHDIAEMRPVNLRVVTIITILATCALIGAIWMLV